MKLTIKFTDGSRIEFDKEAWDDIKTEKDDVIVTKNKKVVLVAPKNNVTYYMVVEGD